MRSLQPWRLSIRDRTPALFKQIRLSRQLLSLRHRHSGSGRLFVPKSERSKDYNDDAAEKVTEPRKESDHRAIGVAQGLWTQHPSSSGSPFFLPAGTHILQKLLDFLRAQYPAYGFLEVLTPTLYKKSLWEQSGHWANYKDDMYIVQGGSASDPEKELYGLKPMNCPGHCLLFASKRRSYRDLPIRYADFSPLHRNENSGALSGLTRVRRFHQDDGHIFCLPQQIQREVKDQLRFIDMVYGVFGLKVYKILLSTRPSESYIGDLSDWENAENQLKDALDQTAMQWSLNIGDGAFYGPKIDVIVQDNDGKEHQTATIQLDFQLPKRFNLTYADGETAIGDRLTDRRSEPVMIHRAIFGSLERFIALLTEHYDGRWPFWLNPNQVVICAVSNSPKIVEYAETVAALLRNAAPQTRQRLHSPTYSVDVDISGDSISKKIARAKDVAGRRHSLICIVGEKNVNGESIDLDISGMRNQDKVRAVIHRFQRGIQDPGQRTSEHDGASSKLSLSLQMKPTELAGIMKKWTDDYL